MSKKTQITFVKEPVIEPVIEPEPKNIALSEIIGTIVGCKKLNIREKPTISSGVVFVEKCGTELMIDLKELHPGWYKVYSEAGATGYCMKKFIKEGDF